MKKSKYIIFQTRKILSSYGGVGSIIETPKGALIIEKFDKWKFFRNDLHKEFQYEIEDKYEIEDNRLLKRLKYEKAFPKLKKFIRVPSNTAKPFNTSIPNDDKSVVNARYFPEWFFCTNCCRFMHLNEWWKGWKNVLSKYNESNIREKFFMYGKPNCFKCYDSSRKKYDKKGKRQKLYYDLEQVRFIITAPNGNIKDIPWERWPSAEKNVKEENSNSGRIKLDFNNLCCDNPDLRYIKSTKFADLAGIRIECKNCGKKNTLAGLFGLRIPVYNKKGVFYKPVIRTSNSVYYPLLINSIYLPSKETIISADDKELIDNYMKENQDLSSLYLVFKSKYNKKTIDNYINQRIEFEPEIIYRLKEYNFITKNKNFKDEEKDNLIFENQDISILKNYGFNNLIKFKRLKLTTVQTGYTRQEPFDKDLFLKEGDKESNIKIKYTSTQGKLTKYLPATESYGEGIFIDLKSDHIEEWFTINWERNKNFKNRIEKVMKNSNTTQFVVQKRFRNPKYLSKFILIHTLSHILIKEFEFLCGYPAASLNERLFVDKDNMQGVLIYTVAGSEGSYGGLISQAKPEKFKKILESALFRAKDCASDPVCYRSDGQGVGGLNLAACYSCALLPETSCEEFNCFLDRALLIDENFGYFQ